MSAPADLLAWLEKREPQPPRELRTRIEQALASAAPDGPVAERLAEAAVECVTRVLRSPDERRIAGDLLAADALLTYACEAAAESGVEELDALTARYAPDRLASVLRQEGDAGPDSR